MGDLKKILREWSKGPVVFCFLVAKCCILMSYSFISCIISGGIQLPVYISVRLLFSLLSKIL